ncbi:hypothetical protein H312_02750, partial [Anncaliia algerae PRA339]
MNVKELIKKYFIPFCSEMGCTFIFGFLVYASIIGANQIESPAVPVIVGLTIAFGSIAIIYTFRFICPAHFNPAITFAAIVFLKIKLIDGIIFIIAQLCGFMIAAGVVLGCFPENRFFKLNLIRPKAASPDVSYGNIICTEIFLTGILVFVAFAVGINPFKEWQANPEEIKRQGRKPTDESYIAPLAIGLTLGFLAFCGLSSSGGVFNPGIVWAPVLFTGNWRFTWQYWIGEFVGGVCGAGLQIFLVNRNIFPDVSVV